MTRRGRACTLLLLCALMIPTVSACPLGGAGKQAGNQVGKVVRDHPGGSAVVGTGGACTLSGGCTGG